MTKHEQEMTMHHTIQSVTLQSGVRTPYVEPCAFTASIATEAATHA